LTTLFVFGAAAIQGKQHFINVAKVNAANKASIIAASELPRASPDAPTDLASASSPANTEV
jgi:hypothetical protein